MGKKQKKWQTQNQQTQSVDTNNHSTEEKEMEMSAQDINAVETEPTPAEMQNFEVQMDALVEASTTEQLEAPPAEIVAPIAPMIDYQKLFHMAVAKLAEAQSGKTAKKWEPKPKTPRVYIAKKGEYKGHPTLHLLAGHEGEPEDTFKALISFGADKARAIMAHRHLVEELAGITENA